MSPYTLSSKPIHLIDEYDILVAGGGPSGCAAAAAAARHGARVLLIESTGILGGMGTAGLVTCWCPFSDGEKIIYRGIAEEVFTASKRATPHIDPEALDWVAFDPEALKVIYDDLLADAGVDVLFNTTACAVEMREAGAVDAVILANKQGITAVRAKIYIDGTGDGDLAAWAGAPSETGSPDSGELQPVTHCFMLSNVDQYAYQTSTPMHALFDDVQKSGRYPLVKDRHGCNSLIGPATVGFNSGHLWDVDNTDPWAVSKALAQGRKLARQLQQGLAEFHPAAFGNAMLVQTAPLLGVRETRRVLGDYVLTVEDYLARQTFADEIGRNCYPIDIHTTKAEAAAGGPVNAMERYENFGPGESHGIPYRCLTPKGVKNVLIAGRSISTDRAVQGSTRVMPVCLVMGQAAGVAATLATGCGDVHAVDTEALRTSLRADGAHFN